MGAPQLPNARDLAKTAQAHAERANDRLDRHEDECARRYTAVESQFQRIEQSLDRQHKESQQAIADMRRESGEGRARLYDALAAQRAETRKTIDDLVEAAAGDRLSAAHEKLKFLKWAVLGAGGALLSLAGYVLKMKGLL